MHDFQHQPRSISPFMYSSNKQQSRAADISRLLDPSYCSAPSKGYVSPQAYVDPYGDLHDPDYRHFPTSFPSSSSTSSKRYNNSPRPHWELALDNENALDDDSDELDEEDSFFLSTSTSAHPRYSAARRSSNNSGRRRPRESSFSTYTTTYSSNYYSPSITNSTLPTSYESDMTVLSRCSDTEEKDGKKTKKRRRLSKGDKEKEKEREGSTGGSAAVVAAGTYYVGSLDRSRDLPPTEEEEAEDDQLAQLGSSATYPRGAIIRSTTVEFVPTCTYNLRRQWAALSLRFRFSVFRAQRKVMRRVHSLL